MKCKFIKSDGQTCNAHALKDSEYCFTHDPDHQEEKKLAVTKGGLARKHYQVYGEPVSINTPKDIQSLLGLVVSGVWTGEIPSNQPANTLGFLARCWLDAYEKCEIESRMNELEKKVDKLVNKTN